MSLAFVATTRFGLGARPGDLEAVGGDARDWLAAQLDAPPPDVLGTLPPTPEAVAQLGAMKGAEGAERKEAMQDQRDRFAHEQALHLVAAAASPAPFRERLVAFWSNHFTVSVARKQVAFTAGAFEREVVRAHLSGTFEEMLVASTRHPAMLSYLDNVRSVGPGSPAGAKSGKGLNENLAREVLELHTLGSGGGYGQADVEAFARVLTGWTVDVDAPEPGYVFHARRHEPGPRTVVGVTTPGRGEEDGRMVLRALASHPSTARHVATRLARHFVADEPPQTAVDALAAAFTASGGHLPTVHRALLDLPDAWSRPLSKLKSPWDLVVSTARALGLQQDGQAMLASLVRLGQVPQSAPSPQGWPDSASEWLGPEALLSRLDWAEEVSRRVRVTDVPSLARSVLGPVLPDSTRDALAAARGPDALALFLACPAFQRR